MPGEANTGILLAFLFWSFPGFFVAGLLRSSKRQTRLPRRWLAVASCVGLYAVTAMPMLLRDEVGVRLFEIAYAPFSGESPPALVRFEAAIHWPASSAILALAYPDPPYLDVPLLWPRALFASSIGLYGWALSVLALVAPYPSIHRRSG